MTSPFRKPAPTATGGFTPRTTKPPIQPTGGFTPLTTKPPVKAPPARPGERVGQRMRAGADPSGLPGRRLGQIAPKRPSAKAAPAARPLPKAPPMPKAGR